MAFSIPSLMRISLILLCIILQVLGVPDLSDNRSDRNDDSSLSPEGEEEINHITLGVLFDLLENTTNELFSTREQKHRLAKNIKYLADSLLKEKAEAEKKKSREEDQDNEEDVVKENQVTEEEYYEEEENEEEQGQQEKDEVYHFGRARENSSGEERLIDIIRNQIRSDISFVRNLFRKRNSFSSSLLSKTNRVLNIFPRIFSVNLLSTVKLKLRKISDLFFSFLEIIKRK
jgi:vacuolar-type H+-ATPase subunit I/STV1